MLKYVKDGALDLLAFTLPSSILDSIKSSDNDPHNLTPSSHSLNRHQRPSHLTYNGSSTLAARAVTPSQRHHVSGFEKGGTMTLFQDWDSLHRSPSSSDTRPLDLSASDPSSSSPFQEHSSSSSIHFTSNNPSETTRTSHPQLPYELVTLIFQYLPASAMFSVLGVCRSWRQIALKETRHVDLSEAFPLDCLGLENDEYSDFDFVYQFFSIFPLVSSLVIKDRYLRDRDLRVVTAGILAGKMAFTKATMPLVDSTLFLQAQRNAREGRPPRAYPPPSQTESRSSPPRLLSPSHQERKDSVMDSRMSAGENHNSNSVIPRTTTTSSMVTQQHKVMRGTIKEELRAFSKSVGLFVLTPKTRNTLRKKIMAKLEDNLEQKELQDLYWMHENGIDPALTLPSSTLISTLSSDLILPRIAEATAAVVEAEKYPLVPMTHYRFQDCCFPKDWGSDMDVNKLPMIGLAAAISGQGLFVDLEGSYGAPSRSIRLMIGFCFGANCVISLDLGFRHTHMELVHVCELLSENPILYRIDIVDSPAWLDLVGKEALRGLGGVLERIWEGVKEVDEEKVEGVLQAAEVLLRELRGDMEAEEDEEREKVVKVKVVTVPASSSASTLLLQGVGVVEDVEGTSAPRTVPNDLERPIRSLAGQLPFPEGTKLEDKIRTAKVLLKGVVQQGVSGLVNTRDPRTGDGMLHSLAWSRAYASLAATALIAAQRKDDGQSRAAMTTTTGGKGGLPTPPTTESGFPFGSSFPPRGYFSVMGSGPSTSGGDPSSLGSSAPVVSQTTTMTTAAMDAFSSRSLSFSLGGSKPLTVPSITNPPPPSALSSLMSALSFRRKSFSTLPGAMVPGEDSVASTTGAQVVSRPDDANISRTSLDSCLSFSSCDSRPSEPVTPSLEPTSSSSSSSSSSALPPASTEIASSPVLAIPEDHPVARSLRMAKKLLDLGAKPNVYNKDGRSAVVCASYMGFQPMESLLIEQGGYSKELIRIRETM